MQLWTECQLNTIVLNSPRNQEEKRNNCDEKITNTIFSFYQKALSNIGFSFMGVTMTGTGGYHGRNKQ